MNAICKLSFFFLFVTFFVACSDDDSTNNAVDQLELTINSPSDNSTFSVGDIITLTFTARDDIRITSVAWFSSEFGTGSVPLADIGNTGTEFSGEFLIDTAGSTPGTHTIDVSATDEDFNNVVEERLTVIIE
jgi:hypothetical protein